MGKKITPSRRVLNEISEMLSNALHSDSSRGILSRLARLSIDLVTQEAWEAEQRDFIGVDRYERAGERRGYRSGYERRCLKTAEGAVEVMPGSCSPVSDSKFAAISQTSLSSFRTSTSARFASVGLTMFLYSHVSAMRSGSGKPPVPELLSKIEMANE